MRTFKAFMSQLTVCVSLGLMGCQSNEKQSEGITKARVDELDVTEDDANAAIDQATGSDEGTSLNQGDEADFLNTGGSIEDFASEAAKKPGSHNLFEDEAEFDTVQAPKAKAKADPASGEQLLGQENIGNDPTAQSLTDSTAQQVLPVDEGDPIAAAAAAESADLTVASSDSIGVDASNDVVPIAQDSDQTPVGFIEQTAAASSAPIVSAAAPAAAPPVVKSDPAPEEIEPASSLLSWVGYRIAEKERQLKIEIFAQGRPDFEVYEETNKAQQQEVVLRFYQTRLRRKIHWDINSSEFASPVAYIRLREFKDKAVVDVVLTHRDSILPQFYAHDGRMLLIYSIPEHYFSQTKTAIRQIKDKAISLVAGDEAPLRRTAAMLKAGPEQLGHRRTSIFLQEPTAFRPIKDVLRSPREDQLDDKGLPKDFDRKVPIRQERAANYRIEAFSMSAVAQDDFDESPAEDADTQSEEAGDAPKIPKKGASAIGGSNESAANESVIQDVPTEIEEAEDAPLPAEDPVAVPEPIKAVEGTPPLPKDTVSANSAAVGGEVKNLPTQEVSVPDPVADVTITNEAADPAPAPAVVRNQPVQPASSSMPSSSIEMTGQINPNAGQQYVGKPIFMEFYDAPLSLVLKSFSEETGNNFVYSSAIAATPVTVHFKGVPWDEALKAILETYSLGMVRIGENVVRVDQVTRLTQYMQELEQAKQFEVRRVPTKVLVFRLNNAVSKDVAQRLAALLARDIELDARTKIQADDRTNSIIMEASTQVLAKTKAIIERLDLETPQVEIASRIVEVQKTLNNFFGLSWGNSFNFDPGRALGFGSLNFPNSVGSSFAVDPGVNAANTAGVGRFRFGSLNKFVDLDLLLKMEEKRGTTNVLQSNRVLVLDGQKASILAGNSKFFRPAAGAANPVPGAGGAPASGSAAEGLSEVKFNLSLEVKPQITALGSVIMALVIRSDTPGDPTGEALASKNTRELQTQMVRESGDTGVIGGIYDTNRTTSVTGVPLLLDIPILGALFRSTQTVESQTELLIMVTPTIVSGRTTSDEQAETAAIKRNETPEISTRDSDRKRGTSL